METVALAGLDGEEAQALVRATLVALQDALRKAMASGPAAAEDASFWADLDRAYAAYDGWIALVARQNPLSCARGCTACCHDNPHGVAGVELARLRRRLRQDGLDQTLAPAFTEAARAFAALASEAGGAEAMRHQRARRRPCPLLGPGGDCRAYAQRPVACRMFHALTPASWCDPAHPDFARRQNPNLLPPLVCRQILGAISRCLGLPAQATLWEGMAAEGMAPG